MGYTTYLLGAGASAKKIPTYFSQTNNFTKEFSNFIWRYFEENESKIIVKQEIKDLIIGIRNEAIKHHTLDTYAKKLFLMNETGKTKLKMLKLLISYFLEHLQVIQPDQTPYDIIDYRYDVLLSSILTKSDDNPILIDNIRFISWNYDNQLEMALLNFNNEVLDTDNMMDMYNFFPQPKLVKETDISKIKIVKLNGIARKYISKQKSDQIIIRNHGLDSGIDKFIIRFKKAMSEFNAIEFLINFAWENNAISKLAIKYSKDILSKTDKLIIIGYSFPGYNHDIDMDLFSNLKYPAKILYQSGDKNSVNEKRKIKSLLKVNYKKDVKIEHTDYCDNFILPHQFNQYF